MECYINTSVIIEYIALQNTSSLGPRFKLDTPNPVKLYSPTRLCLQTLDDCTCTDINDQVTIVKKDKYKNKIYWRYDKKIPLGSGVNRRWDMISIQLEKCLLVVYFFFSPFLSSPLEECNSNK